MSVSKLERLEQVARFTRIGNSAVKKAQDESRRLGVPNVYMHNGTIFYENRMVNLLQRIFLQKNSSFFWQ